MTSREPLKSPVESVPAAEGGATALLFVGDVDTLPSRFMKLDRGTKEAFDATDRPQEVLAKVIA